MLKRLLPFLIILSASNALSQSDPTSKFSWLWAQEALTAPRTTDCSTLKTPQKVGSLCFDTNSDLDSDGTSGDYYACKSISGETARASCSLWEPIGDSNVLIDTSGSGSCAGESAVTNPAPYQCWDTTDSRLYCSNGTSWIACQPGSNALGNNGDVQVKNGTSLAAGSALNITSKVIQWADFKYLDFDANGDGTDDERWCGDYDDDGTLEWYEDDVACNCTFQGLSADCSTGTARTTPWKVVHLPGTRTAEYRSALGSDVGETLYIKASNGVVEGYGVNVVYSGNVWKNTDGAGDDYPKALDDLDAARDYVYTIYLLTVSNVVVSGFRIDGGSQVMAQDEAGNDAVMAENGSRNDCNGNSVADTSEIATVVALRSASNDCTVDLHDVIQITGSTNIALRDIIVTQADRRSVYVSTSTDVLFDNLDISYSGEHGMAIVDSTNAKVINSNFSHAGSGAALLYYNTQGMTYTGNSCVDSLSNCLRVEIDGTAHQTYRLTATGNIMNGTDDSDADGDGSTTCGTSGTSCGPLIYVQSQTATTHYSRDITITGNQLYVGPTSWKQGGIALGGNSVLPETYDGHVVISGNNIVMNPEYAAGMTAQTYGISTTMAGSLVTGNNIDIAGDSTSTGDSYAVGIELTAASCAGCTAEGNIVRAIGTKGAIVGIEIDGASNTIVRDNTIDLVYDGDGNGTNDLLDGSSNPYGTIYGIRTINASATSQGRIAGNTINVAANATNGNYGIYIQAGATRYIVQDNVCTGLARVCIWQGVNSGAANHFRNNMNHGGANALYDFWDQSTAGVNIWEGNTGYSETSWDWDGNADDDDIRGGHGWRFLYDDDGNGTTDTRSSIYLYDKTDLCAEGATVDANKACMTFADPAADTTVTVPAKSGTVVLASAANTSGVVLWGDGSDSFDTGNEVCTNVGLTCLDVYTPAGDSTTQDCTTDMGTAGTRFYSLCY